MEQTIGVGRLGATWNLLMKALAAYHRFDIVGLEHVPVKGGAIVTCTHSLATYDLLMMGALSKKLVGRQAYIILDDLVFRLPGIKEQALEAIGFVRGGRQNAIARLKAGTLLGIAPGGMAESLRPSHKRFEFDWSRRKGFVSVALKSGCPIIPAVCPAADDIFTVYENRLTNWVYHEFKVPLPVFRGFGPTLVPRPIKLVAHIGAAIYPHVPPDEASDRDIDIMHRKVVRATKKLLKDATTKRRLGYANLRHRP